MNHIEERFRLISLIMEAADLERKRRKETPDVTDPVSIPTLRSVMADQGPGNIIGVSCRELRALLDAADALREIARPDDLVAANEDAFSIHAYRRCVRQAEWAIARFDFGDDT